MWENIKDPERFKKTGIHIKNKIMTVWWTGWMFLPTSFVTLSLPVSYRLLMG